MTPKDQKETKLKDIKLELLIELDPTKIETGEHVFVSLLYKLNALIEKQRNCHCSTADDFKYEAYRKQFKKLAGGLQLLDERKKPLQDIDSEAFLDWGLERVESGIALADEFKTLLKYSCELLNIDALIISIDDADTNFSKGKQVLETIRRYLDSSYLLIVMTGDLQLYSHLVRDFYYESLGENIFKHDQHRKEEQIKLIDHLETQYLNKLFPLHHRTHLTSLWDLRLKTDYSVKFEDGQQLQLPLDDIIERLLKEGMYIKSDRERDLNLYKEFLLKQSLRSIIQLLQFCTQGMEESAETKTKTKTKIFTPKRVAEGFRAVFRGSLHTHQVDVNTLSSGDINTLNDAVFRVVLEDGEFDTGCYLRPQPSKKSLRNCFVALAAEVARHCEKRPDYAIDYILQGLGSITLYDLISETSWTKLTDEQKQQQFRSYFSIGRNENSLNWARHASAVLAGNDAVSSGVIRIPPFIRIENSEIVHFPVIFLSRVNITDGNNTKTYASIFNILGIVVQFLSLTESSSQKKDRVLSELVHYSIPLTVSEPPWKEDTKEENKNKLSSCQDKDINYKLDELDSLAGNIVKWLGIAVKSNEQIKPSAVFLGKVWTRLYFSLLNASIHIQTKNEGIASIMELYALCLINAFLIEESSYHYANKSEQAIDSTNPINIDDDTLISKLKSINEFKIEQFPLTSMIITCPLILGLIRKEKVEFLLANIKVSDKSLLGCDNSLFDVVNETKAIYKPQTNQPYKFILKKKFNSND